MKITKFSILSSNGELFCERCLRRACFPKCFLSRAETQSSRRDDLKACRRWIKRARQMVNQ